MMQCNAPEQFFMMMALQRHRLQKGMYTKANHDRIWNCRSGIMNMHVSMLNSAAKLFKNDLKSKATQDDNAGIADGSGIHLGTQLQSSNGKQKEPNNENNEV